MSLIQKKFNYYLSWWNDLDSTLRNSPEGIWVKERVEIFGNLMGVKVNLNAH